MKRSLIALALAAMLPLSAQAGEIKYSFIEAGYASSDFFDETFDGYALKGSIEFGGNFYGSLSYRDVDNNDFDVQFDETVLNLGYHHSLSDKADFIAEIGYVRVGTDLGSFGSDSSDGYRVAAGFRGLMAPKFEGEIKGYYTDINDLGDAEFGVTLGSVFHINQTWGITASYDYTKFLDENIGTWGLGVRASF